MAEELAASIGVEKAASIPELAAESSVLMLCVTNSIDVEECLLGRQGAAASLAKGSLVIDTNTTSPKVTESIAARLAAMGIGFVDAPVSGGSEGAALGTLAIMAAGTDVDFERAKPVLEKIGTRITQMGEAGKGQVTKLVNQILVVVNMLAVSEAMMFGEAAGLDMRKAVARTEHPQDLNSGS